MTDKPLILMTGCSGLIGGRLIDALHDEYTIAGLDVAEPDGQSGNGLWIECDLTDDDSVNSAMEQVRERFGDRIASVIHLAAYYDFSGQPSPMYEKLTVQGTRRLVDALQSFDTEQLIFSSSLLAMKPVDDADEQLTEDSPTRGEWDYPQSKLEAERVLRRYHRDIPVVVHRIAGVYDQTGHSLPVAQHIKRIYERQLESYFFPGDPTHGQAFIHLDDLVDCFRLTIQKRRELGGWEMFLVAEPDVMSHEQLQDEIGELIHGREWPTIRIPKSAAKLGAWAREKLTGEDLFIKPWMIDLADDHYAVQIDHAREKLGWNPRHRLRNTLPAMIQNLKQDPRRWYEANNLPLPDKFPEPEVSRRA